VGSVEDRIDLRTRLIFASLEDDDLVRQLREGMTGVRTVIDLRDVQHPQQPSEWSVDDPSYFLG
jgi:hypothetical protein